MKALRSFLYLDTQMVSDYLSALDDGLFNNQKIVETHESTGKLSGESNIPLLKAGGSNEAKDKRELTRETVQTDASRFQRLLEALHKDQTVNYYSTMSAETWSTIHRHDVVELDVTLAVSKVHAMFDAVSDLANATRLIEAATGASILDKEAEAAIKGFDALSKMDGGKGIPVVMRLIGTPDYVFTSHLSLDCLRVAKEKLSGEATVLCKVQRKIEAGEKVELFKPLSAIENLPLNRKQRRTMPKASMPPELRDSVKGPGAVVIPVAIYR